MVNGIRAVAASALVSLVFAAGAAAAPGDPDPSFGGDGFATIDFDKSSEGASAVDVMADGRIVIGGFHSGEGKYASYLARLMPDGSFDPSFGFGGIRPYNDLCGAGTRPIRDLEILPDGRILTAGTCENDFQLMRFNVDGTPDLSFDGDKGNPGKGNGVVRTAFFEDASASAIAVDLEDASITVGGLMKTPEQTTAFARYDLEGRLDKSFDGPFANPGGGEGKVVLPDPDAFLDRVEDMVSLGGGRVAWTNNRKGDALAGELAPDGNPLKAFGDDGYATADFGDPNDEGEAIAADPLGRLLVAGVTGAGFNNGKTAVVRFLPNGEVDPGFGTPVFDLRPGLGEQPLAVVVQPDGKILVVGYGYVPLNEISSFSGRLLVIRLTPEGALDPSFAAGGILSLGGPQGGATGIAGALDPAGRLVVAGISINYPASMEEDALVARFQTAADPVAGPPPAPPSNRFRFAGLKRNKKAGTATLFVEVPGAGRVSLAQTKKLKAAAKTATAAAKVGIPIKLKGKAGARLKLLAAQKSPKPGRFKVGAQVTFAPTGGDALTQPKQIGLVRKSDPATQPAAAASKAKAKPKTCKPGQGVLAIGKKSTCVKAGSLLPSKKLGPNTPLGWFNTALDLDVGAAAKSSLPKRLRGPEMGRGVAAGVKTLRKGLAPYGARMEGRAAGAKLSAMEFATAPVVTANQSPGSVSLKGSIQGVDKATGTTAEASIELRAKAGSEVLEFDFAGTVKDKDGKSKSTELSLPLDFKTLKMQRCPTATGEISRSSKVNVRKTTRERGTPPGFEYRNESVTVEAPITIEGKVNADAALESVAYRVDGKFNWSYAASALLGLARGNIQMNVDFDAQGTLDGGTGAITSGTTSLSGRMRAFGLDSKEEKAEMAKRLADPEFRKSFLDLVAKLVQYEYEALKKSEKAWQVPNACAKMTLTPPGATLNEGDFKAVSGSVAAEDGKPTEGRWSVASRSRGEISGVPGSSSAAAPIEMEMTGGAASGSGRTVDLKLRATSPAGVAEAPWTADGNEQTLYYRVVGASGTQTASGSLETTSCVYDQVGGVPPWTYAFEQTSGEPDGEVTVDRFGVSGYVRGSGVSTLPAYTWRSTCGKSVSTFAHESIVYDGRFGPSVAFFGDPGQSQVKAQWGVLSPPPIFQVDIAGPDCTPDEFEAGSPFAAQVPLSTLQQTTPFTISIDAPWSTVTEFGNLYTECEGHTSLSLTLQRVGPDGAPLS